MSADGQKLLIITGQSGAGKGVVLRCLEDLGYYCVDNMLPPLIPKFLDLTRQSATPIRAVALVVDIRERNYFRDIFGVLQYLAEQQADYQMIFLAARDEVLIRRYSETRRRHPLSDCGQTVAQAVAAERELLEEIKGRANLVLDTSDFPLPALRTEIQQRFRLGGGKSGAMQTNLLSFGFKYGLPLELDLLFDVRFLPNPYYISRFQDLDGLHPEVRDYICKWPDTTSFLARLDAFLNHVVPLYQREGKAALTIGIGCTGGRHRSVVVAERLAVTLAQALTGLELQVQHRDLQRR